MDFLYQKSLSPRLLSYLDNLQTTNKLYVCRKKICSLPILLNHLYLH